MRPDVADVWRSVHGDRPRPRTVREQTLDALVASVHGTKVDRLRAELLDDPVAYRAARVAALRREVDPANAALVAKAAWLREFYALRRRREEQLFPLWASGDFTHDLREHWRLLAGAGDEGAGVLLASAARRTARAVTAAVIASGAGAGTWKVRRVGEHEQAVREVWGVDGRITKHIRWRYRAMGGWLTTQQFEARVRAARVRQRRAARQIPAVGRPARRAR